ncbi:hypothetical protein [uncultured Bacteroides sp.]|uniref:hypothetical protein n=1 Tax=uncultured Bacteroides sp. TaxID=162156 RepID=UPI002AAB6348|nr:hypothetical protein [uncultured Bacteroides sp.]
MENIAYFDKYEEKLTEVLMRLCTDLGVMNGQLLAAEELEEKWKEIVPEYMVDAVPQIKDYPTVSVAWAGYLGIGLAVLWDRDWVKYKDDPNLYKFFVEPRGFDCMDEFILEELLGVKLESKEFLEVEGVMRSCAKTAVDMIRKEGIEPQSPDAFYVFARSVKVLFKIGVSVALKRLGYKYEKVAVANPSQN